MTTISSVSIIVVGFNAAARLPATIRALSRLTCPPQVALEFIYVDNRSTDDSVAVVEREWESSGGLGRFGPWRIFHEATPGSTFARRTGVKHAVGDVVLFVDDDNSLCEDYISRGVSLFEEMPDLGACGGTGNAVSTIPLPDWFPRFQSMYACGADGAGRRTTLPTAGLFIRERALRELEQLGFTPVLEGRVGANTMAGEDYELTEVLSLMRWRLWKDSRLHFDHHLEPHRLTEDYCLRLITGLARSNVFVCEYARWVAYDEGRSVLKLWVPWIATLSLQWMYYSARLCTAHGTEFYARCQRATLAGTRDGAALGLRHVRFRRLRHSIRQLLNRIWAFQSRSASRAIPRMLESTESGQS